MAFGYTITTCVSLYPAGRGHLCSRKEDPVFNLERLLQLATGARHSICGPIHFSGGGLSLHSWNGLPRKSQDIWDGRSPAEEYKDT